MVGLKDYGTRLLNDEKLPEAVVVDEDGDVLDNDDEYY